MSSANSSQQEGGDEKDTKETKVGYWQDPRDSDGRYVGTHTFMVKAERFIVDFKYAPLKPLGSGAYGVVCSAKDRVLNKRVNLTSYLLMIQYIKSKFINYI